MSTMTRSDYTLDQLDTRSDGFLVNPVRQPMGDGVLVTADMRPNKFSQSLYDRLNVNFPDSLERAIDKRRAEFLAGRCMAHMARQAIGQPLVDIPIGEGRAPVWPAGGAGSISHARGLCGCLALPHPVRGVGLDVERVAEGQGLESILRMTVSKQDRALIENDAHPARLATQVFSAKETLFKALYPTVKAHFGFDAARVVGDPSSTHLHLQLTRDLHPDLPASLVFKIGSLNRAQHVISWLIVPAGG